MTIWDLQHLTTTDDTRSQLLNELNFSGHLLYLTQCFGEDSCLRPQVSDFLF
jgi:hypothetical protein